LKFYYDFDEGLDFLTKINECVEDLTSIVEPGSVVMVGADIASKLNADVAVDFFTEMKDVIRYYRFLNPGNVKQLCAFGSRLVMYKGVSVSDCAASG